MQGLSKTERIDLPEVLVLEIMSKLPVKFLTRFMCVCKPWSSSFQTPFFIAKHLHNNLRNNNLNLLHKVDGPCNGILCLASDRDKVALWNPSTRELKILPQSSVQRPPLVDSTSFDCLGFGLLDFNGLLGVIFFYPVEGTEKSFDLWVMNESWTKQFSIESVPGVGRLLGFWKKE
ncbi:hypothetical protein V6N13_064437 [Hibiscus sabdariffa]|uniref:F-box domain-containing protein n=1 Tax=Hibiscus sabdariffa TaxID=183260 RepID=A0ABR2EC59_9ROSI